MKSRRHKFRVQIKSRRHRLRVEDTDSEQKTEIKSRTQRLREHRIRIEHKE